MKTNPITTLSMRWPRSAFVNALALNAALFATYIAFITPKFDTNDDVVMMSIVEGLFTGAPDPHLIHTNVVIGSLLQRLYALNGDVNWYTCYFLVVHFSAMTALAAGFFQRLGAWGLGPYALILFGFEIRLLERLQFTTVASIAALAGILIILNARLYDRKWAWINASLGAVLLVLSGLVRIHGCLLVIVLCSPLILYELTCYRAIRTVACSLAMAAIALFALGHVDRNSYFNDEGWHAFVDYHAKRSQIENSTVFDVLNDPTSDWDTVGPVLHQVGWSLNDAKVYAEWFYTDKDLYSSDNLAAVYSGLGPRFRSLHEGWKRLKPVVTEAKSYLALLCLTVALALALGFSTENLLLRLTVLATIALVVAACCGLAFSSRLPSRVIVSILLGGTTSIAILMSGLASHGNFSIKSRLAGNRLVAGALILLVCGLGIVMARQALNLRGESDHNRRNQIALDEFLQRLRTNVSHRTPKPVFVIWNAGWFPYGWIGPLADHSELQKQVLVPLSWYQHSPILDRQLEKLEVNNLYESLYLRDDFFLICQPHLIELYEQFISEHFDKTVVCDLVYQSAVREHAVHVYKPVVVPNVETVNTDAGSTAAPAAMFVGMERQTNN